MKNERVDETIDRVAAGLTSVSADPGFGLRLRDRLETPPRGVMSMLLLVSATVALVVVAGVALLQQRAPAAPGLLQSASLPSAFTGLAAAQEAGPAVASGGEPGLAPGKAEAAARAGAGLRAGGVGQADTMPLVAGADEGLVAEGPAALTVDPLTVEAVALPAVADIAPLEVPNLQIAEIFTGDRAKEPK